MNHSDVSEFIRLFCFRRRRDRRYIQVVSTQTEHVESRVVVLVGLSDPVHPHAPRGGRGGRGAIAITPPATSDLDADLEVG
jgi:hypothetical protein